MFNVRRAQQRYDSSSMNSLLTPGYRAPPPRNFHRENLLTMQKKERELAQRREEQIAGSNSPTSQWKLKRFASVGSKLSVRGMTGNAQNR